MRSLMQTNDFTDAEPVGMDVDGGPGLSEAEPASKKARTAADAEPSVQTASAADGADLATTSAAPTAMEVENAPATIQSTNASVPSRPPVRGLAFRKATCC